MATIITSALLDAALDALLADVAFAALHTASPGVDGTTGELAADGYERAAVTFAAASGGEAANDAHVDFVPDGEDWPEATHVSFWTDDVEPVFLLAAALATPRAITDNNTGRFVIGELVVSARAVEPA